MVSMLSKKNSTGKSGTQFVGRLRIESHIKVELGS